MRVRATQQWYGEKGFATFIHIQACKLINYFGHVCSQTITLHKSGTSKRTYVYANVFVDVNVCVWMSVFVDVSIRNSERFFYERGQIAREHVALGRKRKWSNT